MPVTISQRARRIVALAVCNKDAAEAFCDVVENGSGVANGDQLVLYITLSDLGAGDDLANFPLIQADIGLTLDEIHLIAHGDFAGIDASNTMVVTIKDGASNTIVTKTFDDTTVPGDDNDLGTLNGTHKILTANELCKVSITNGATADPPLLGVALVFHVT